MKERALGKSGIKVSEISLGCWTMGGLNWVNGEANGWANVDEAEVARAIDMGLEKGVSHFDNADVYGNGKAERMLARILGERSKKVSIASKVGHFPGTAEHAYEALNIRHQCEQSLANLKREAIDAYYFHHGDFGPNDRYVDGAVAEMRKLKKEGKIRSYGLSAYSNDDFTRLVPKIEPDYLQSWANAMDIGFIKKGTPVRELLDKKGLKFVAFSPLAQGLLMDRYKPGAAPKFEEGDHRRGDSTYGDENLKKVEAQMAKIKSRFGSSPEELARVALQYLLTYDVIACVIPGFRNPKQVELNLAGADKPLSAEDAAYIESVFGV
jgi:aryl-alcohol dehydrogenase-like predicted oxidoreductase